MTDQVTLTRGEYEALLERIADLEDSIAVLAQRVAGDGTVPMEVVAAKAGGEHPLRAWRTYRGLSERDLATRCGLTVNELIQIETGRRPGSVEALRALAAVLEVPTDWLLPQPTHHGQDAAVGEG